MFLRGHAWRSLALAAVCFALVAGAAAGSPPPYFEQRQAIADIVQDISTAEKRSQAISRLMAIVAAQDSDVHLRRFAAAQLGDLEAREAKDMLKELALKQEMRGHEVYLQRAAAVAYWKIVVAELPSREIQEELLMSLLSEFAPQPEPAGVVWKWAVDELANRGVERALPRMEKCIKRRIGADGKRADYEIWLCKTKVDLLTKYPDRHMALAKALVTRDPNQDQKVIRWAIDELGKLDTRKSRRTLIKFAVRLQRRYHTFVRGRRILVDVSVDPLGARADLLYHQVIDVLRASGMTEKQIKGTGLHPDKYFLMN